MVLLDFPAKQFATHNTICLAIAEALQAGKKIERFRRAILTNKLEHILETFKDATMTALLSDVSNFIDG